MAAPNYFQMLGLKFEELDRLPHQKAVQRINKRYDEFHGASLTAGNAPRPDGETQESYRKRLKKARDLLLNPAARREHARVHGSGAGSSESSGAGTSESSRPAGVAVRQRAAAGAVTGGAAGTFYLFAARVAQEAGGAASLFLISVSVALLVLLRFRWFGAFVFGVLGGFFLTASVGAYGGLVERLVWSIELAGTATLALFALGGALLGAFGSVNEFSWASRSSVAKVAVLLLATVGGAIYVVGSGELESDGNGTTRSVNGVGPAVGGESPPTAREIEARLDLGRDEWRRVQGGLQAGGFYRAAIDGLVGPNTRNAIRAWQQTQPGIASGYLDGFEARALMALAPVIEEPDPVSPDLDPPSALPPAGSRLVVRAEPDSRIALDGDASGTTDAEGMLVLDGIQSGRHVLVAEKDGYEPIARVIEVESGRSEVVELALEALPGRLAVTANVDGAFATVDGGESRTLPLDALAVASGVRRVTVVSIGYEPAVENVEVRPGALTTLDVVLERVDMDDEIALVRRLVQRGSYAAAVEPARLLADVVELWERTGLDVASQLGQIHALLGQSLYELGRFDESVPSLYRAILLGQTVVLPANHRHGGGGFRESFCRGVVLLSLKEVAFRSSDDPDHGFAVPPDRLHQVESADMRDGFLFRLNTEVEDRDGGRRSVDFVHRNAERRRQDPDSGLVVVLQCADCDGSLSVQAALMLRLSQSAR